MGGGNVMGKYTTISTSTHTEEVLEPIILDQKTNTRRVFIAVINDQKTDVGETVSGTIIHQRKKNKNEWENIKSINLSTLKGGEGVKLRLNSKQTKKLYKGLLEMYMLSKEGVQYGETEYIVGKSNEIIQVPKERRIFINQLIQKNFGEEIWQALIETKPDLATKLSWARIQGRRKESLIEFEQSLENEKDESYWQKFFQGNQWIFGYGLQYKFLSIETNQPSYGGGNYLGRGNQKGDFLGISESQIKFTVLVEIKKNSTSLLAKRPQSGEHIKYRNSVWLLSDELIGGLSQLQTNRNTWIRNSETRENRGLINRQIYTINPKGILIIGNTGEFNNDIEKIETFELFRNGISGIDIITYDELFERAKFIVSNTESPSKDSVSNYAIKTF